MSNFTLWFNNHQDPVQLRAQVQKVTTDATYRVQYHPERKEMLFGYINPDDDLILSPKVGSNQDLSASKINGELQQAEEESGMIIDGVYVDDSLDEGSNPAKRQKLK